MSLLSDLIFGTPKERFKKAVNRLNEFERTVVLNALWHRSEEENTYLDKTMEDRVRYFCKETAMYISKP